MKSIYSAASGADLSKGVPMTAYLAMGLQESNRAPGWYNEYVEQVYENANYDPEKTSERAKKNIRARHSFWVPEQKKSSSPSLH